MIFVILAVALILAGAVSLAAQRSTNPFIRLRDVGGKTLAEIVSAVGKPTSISTLRNGHKRCQWVGSSGLGKYNYIILIDAEGKAVGYTHL